MKFKKFLKRLMISDGIICAAPVLILLIAALSGSDYNALYVVMTTIFAISVIIGTIYYVYYEVTTMKALKIERAKKEKREEEDKRKLEEWKEKTRQERLEWEKSALTFAKQQVDYEYYSKPIYNFIDKINDYTYFLMDIGLFSSERSFIRFPADSDDLTFWLLNRDGARNLEKNEYNADLFEKTEILVNGLKNKLSDDVENKQALIYLIVRNNIIKYFHDRYLSEYGYEDIDSFCKNIKDINKAAKAMFVYYYIYKTDISLPIVDTYNRIEELYNRKYEEIRKQDIADSIFKDNEIAVSDSRVKNTNNDHTEQKPINIEQIDSMSGRDFEIFIYQLFTKKGYKCELTPTSGDYGIDVIVKDTLGTKIGIQTKCYKDKVSNAAVQEVYAGLKHYNCDKAMIITNSYFTPAAIQAAKENNVTLWDRNELIKNL